VDGGQRFGLPWRPWPRIVASEWRGNVIPHVARSALRPLLQLRTLVARRAPRPFWLLLACVLLLSGCALVPWAQAAGGLLVTLSALVLAACGGGGGGGGGGGQTIVWPSVVSLDQLTPATGFILQGTSSSDRLGFVVAAGRDVNGDGKGDLVVGAPGFYAGGEFSPGAAFVVFGAGNIGAKFFTDSTPIDINLMSAPDGFRVTGSYPGGEAGYSVALAKDVNGDNQADIVIGEPGYSGGRGRAWVLFGDGNLGEDRELYFTSDPPPTVRLQMDGSEGFAMRNEYLYSACIPFNAQNRIGQAVTALDIYGDGLSDVAVSGPYATSYSGSWIQPRVAILFGTSPSVGDFKDISNPGIAGNGFVLNGGTAPTGFFIDDQIASSRLGQSLAVGDVNGDKILDLIVGVHDGISYEGTVGGAVVIFGQSAGGELSWPTTFESYNNQIFQFIDNTPGHSYTGSDSKVAFLGDVNGDGVGDFAVTVPGKHQAFVIFGKDGLADRKFAFDPGGYDALDGTDGFRIDFESVYSACEGRYREKPVAMVGQDFNQDGKSDILIAIAGQGTDPISTSTLAYVIFGKSGIGSSGVLDLTSGVPAGAGVRISGTIPGGYNYAFSYVSAAVGDVNGDGLKDLIIGVADDPYVGNQGRVYVIFSPKPQ
jgi:hypothetical protein